LRGLARQDGAVNRRGVSDRAKAADKEPPPVAALLRCIDSRFQRGAVKKPILCDVPIAEIFDSAAFEMSSSDDSVSVSMFGP